MSGFSPALEAGLDAAVEALPRPLIFASISGSWLYGLASAGSDIDVRAVHLAPTRAVLGLDPPADSVVSSRKCEEVTLDLESFELAKFLRLVLKKNGNVLESVCSPLTRASGPEHRHLQELVLGCLTRHHGRHYLGYSQRHWSDARAGDGILEVKASLHAFRGLMTGLHLLNERQVLLDMSDLVDRFRLSEIETLIMSKRSGQGALCKNEALISVLEKRYLALAAALEEAGRKSPLPDLPERRADLEHFLVDLRIRALSGDLS